MKALEISRGGLCAAASRRNLMLALACSLGADVCQALGEVPIVAEDLGVITPDVHVLREAIGAPGMVVLQFAWGGGYANTHLPHNHYENSVVYPGKPMILLLISGYFDLGCLKFPSCIPCT